MILFYDLLVITGMFFDLTGNNVINLAENFGTYATVYFMYCTQINF